MTCESVGVGEQRRGEGESEAWAYRVPLKRRGKGSVSEAGGSVADRLERQQGSKERVKGAPVAVAKADVDAEVVGRLEEARKDEARERRSEPAEMMSENETASEKGIAHEWPVTQSGMRGPVLSGRISSARALTYERMVPVGDRSEENVTSVILKSNLL